MPSARKIAEHFGIGRTQLDGILKRNLDVIADFENSVPSARKRQLNVLLLFSDVFLFLGVLS